LAKNKQYTVTSGFILPDGKIAEAGSTIEPAKVNLSSHRLEWLLANDYIVAGQKVETKDINKVETK